MSEIIVPPTERTPDGKPFPTLGPQVCDFMEERLVYGPGPLKGQPYKVRDDLRYILYRAYEHFPEGYTLYGEDMTGRRRFNQVNLSFPKGSAKTEFGAEVCITELHPEAPIRFNGYDPDAPGGMAPGRSVISPFIPVLAPTKDQLYDLGYGVVLSVVPMLEDSSLFNINQNRVMIEGESESKIIPVAASASRLDGLKPTFQYVDETHRFFEDRQRSSYDTMTNNLAKRAADDPWQMTTTTAGDPGEPSVARDHYRDGVATAEGKMELARSFFYHRQTSDPNAKFDTMENRLVALKEASGPEVSKMRDLFSVAAEWDKSGNDVTYLERVWCNRWTQSARNAFNKEAFEGLGDTSLIIPPGASVTLGFDGAVTDDSTALIMTEIETGIQNPVGLWERPPDAERWQVPVAEVDAAVEDVFATYDVWFMYYDPPYWTEYGSKWSGQYPGRVIEWPTRNETKIYYAIRAYMEAIDLGDLGHNGNPDFVRHIGNAGRNNLGRYDDEGLEKFRLAKLSRDRKFDMAMAGILSWQARLDALQKGAAHVKVSQVPRKLR